MSKLSNWLHQVGNLLHAAVATAPAEKQQPMVDAGTALKNAAAAVESALPAAIDVGVDALLVSLGWGTYVPAANEVLDLIIAAVEAKKTPQPTTTP